MQGIINKIFSHLKDNPSSIHQIAQNCKLQESDVLRTVLWLQDEHFAKHDGSFYSLVGEFPTEMNKIHSMQALKWYLLDDVERLKNSDYLYHYTSVSAAISIIKDKRWRLSNPQYMNDLLEYKYGNHSEWETIFFASFMAEQKESIGMWSMYSQPWETGVKISIPKIKFRSWIKEIHNIYGISSDYGSKKISVYPEKINIVNVGYSDEYNHEKNQNTIIHWSNTQTDCIEHALGSYTLTGYIKDSAWSYEKEVRILAKDASFKEFDSLEIDIPDDIIDSMVITASPLFKGDLKEKIRSEIPQKISTDTSLFTGKLNITPICEVCKYKKAYLSNRVTIQ